MQDGFHRTFLAGASTPRPPVIAWAQVRYSAVLIADGSTLDVRLRKIGLLREAAVAPLAGRMMALLDLTTRLPRRVCGTTPTRRARTCVSGRACTRRSRPALC